MKCSYCGKRIWFWQTVVISSADDWINILHSKCLAENRSQNQMAEHISRKMSLKQVVFAVFMGIMLGSLIAYSLITRNLVLIRISSTIHVIIALSAMLLGLSHKGSLLRTEYTKFQPSLKELYRKLFKNPPESYILFGAVILIGFNGGIFLILSLFLCVEVWINFCEIILWIFIICFVSGGILMWIGLILSIKKGRKKKKLSKALITK